MLKKKSKSWIATMMFGLFFIVSPVVPQHRTAYAEIIERIVAVVNDDIILLSELKRELRPYVERIKAAGYADDRQERMISKIRSDVLNQMIDQKLTDQEIERAQIAVSEAEIDETIERIKSENYYTDEALEKMLSRRGMTLESYRNRLKEQVLRSRLVNIEVKSKIVITPEDVRAYYEDHRDRYGGETKYHLRNLLMRVSPQAGEMQRQEARKRMETILGKMKAGRHFDKSGTVGRDLGFIGRSKLSPQLKEVLKNLKAGDFTPVLETDQGYQIFYVQDIVTEPGKSLAEASDEIKRELYEEIVNEKFKSWLDDLRKRSHIRIID